MREVVFLAPASVSTGNHSLDTYLAHSLLTANCEVSAAPQDPFKSPGISRHLTKQSITSTLLVRNNVFPY